MEQVKRLELSSNNLYRNGRVVEFDDTDELLLIREPLKIIGQLFDQYHTVTYMDRLDLIAYQYYSDIVSDASKFWWVLADANGIDEPLDLSDFVGKQILIPNILNALLLV